MATYGVDATGFNPKPLSVIISELQAGFIAILGPNTDTDPDSVVGQIVGLVGGAAGEVWEAADEANTNFDPQSAGGVIQSRQVRLNGLTRVAESKTLVTAEVDGVASTFLPKDTTIAETPDGDRFLLVEDVTLTGSPDTSSWIAEKVGPVLCASGTLTIITTPISGWTSITNAAGATFTGELEEKDGTLRRRRETSTELKAITSFTALSERVRNTAGVTDSELLINESGVTDGLGLPAHSFRNVVEGGADLDIAQSIWDAHPIGVEHSGAANALATDSEGGTHTMNWGRPVLKPVFVGIVLTLSAGFPADGDDQIKQAIVDYAAGLLLGADGEPIFLGFKIGDDVLWSGLFNAINTVPGHSVDDLFIDYSASPTASDNLTVTGLEKSTWSITDIDIT